VELNDTAATETVAPLISALGWKPLGEGGLGQARHLEHMTPPWGRLVRANGHSPKLVGAAIKR
jgi:predicted dinucleotide-binding enzyme